MVEITKIFATQDDLFVEQYLLTGFGVPAIHTYRHHSIDTGLSLELVALRSPLTPADCNNLGDTDPAGNNNKF